MKYFFLIFLAFVFQALKIYAQPDPVVELKFTLAVDSDFVIGKYLHSVFTEVDENTFENPRVVVDRPVKPVKKGILEMEPHSVYRLIFSAK
jgi:hypothetical protein